MKKVSILGATGYTGVELVKILLRHPGVELKILTSESNPGTAYSEIYPALAGRCDIILSPNDVAQTAQESDAVFMCLPHGASMDAVAEVYRAGVPVFDLSADYRINEGALYETVYHISHSHKELLDKAAYGLAEIFPEEIKSQPVTAVPGCYPTSILIPLIPLLKEGFIDKNHLIADSKSGVSGAGKKPTPVTHFCEANEDFKPYGIFHHRHKPEIDHILQRGAGADTDIIFTPHLAPLNRGMLSTIYTRSDKTAAELVDVWRKAYKGHPLVRIMTGGRIPAVKHVANTPFIDMALFKQGNNVIIVSALDNLMKGASSQAVQCFNIKMGFNETEGLL